MEEEAELGEQGLELEQELEQELAGLVPERALEVRNYVSRMQPSTQCDHTEEREGEMALAISFSFS